MTLAAAPALLAAGLTAAAVALVLPRHYAAGLRHHPWLVPGPSDASHVPVPADTWDDLVAQQRPLIALLAGAAPLALVGGVLGLLGGALAAVVVYRVLGKREPASWRRRREEVARSLPQVVDLLAVTLASGASPGHALTVVANAMDGPVVTDLRAAERSLALGREPARVWREVADRPGLTALGRTMARAVDTGASVSDSLHRLAEDLHASARLEGESRARAVGVRAAAPLGLCLLPAFVPIGVVPLVAGTVATLVER